MENPPEDRCRRGGAHVPSIVMVRLVAVAIVASLLLLGSASAGQVDPAACRYGAISAIGPVDANGNGDTMPDVACITP
jgi:hypothetical protein